MITPTYQSFTHTSDIPYDKHYYEVVIIGKKHVSEDYNEVRQLCYNTESLVYVKDYKKTKKRVSDTKGFA